ncbi:MAG: hypothetical protein ACMUJM_12390 [bacterium]
MVTKNKLKLTLLISLTLLIGILVCAPIARSQNWVELPPYNTLWPLWSPTLSPVDAATGLPTPIVSALTPDTNLSVMPGLTWDPSMPYPWLLYNTLTGMAYFDPLAGINLWPAPSLLDDAGSAAPIPLPTGYADLPPTDAAWLATNLYLANNSYLLSYQSFLPPWIGPSWLAAPPPYSSLLTPLDILGPTLGVPSALAPLPPPIPAPTIVAPTAAISQVVTEQAGTWEGFWTTGVESGPMTLNIVQDPIIKTAVYGYVQLIGNLNLPGLVEIVGEVLNNQIIASGTGVGATSSKPITIELTAILLSPTEMEGNYTLLTSAGPSIIESGAFQATLLTPVIPPAPVVPAVPAPVPTVITPTIPLPTAPVPTVIAPTAAISQLAFIPAPLAYVEQTGTWQGVWSSGLASGPMTLNIIEDPVLTNTIYGTVQLIGNVNLGVVVEIVGTVLNNQIIASGKGLGIGGTSVIIDLVGTLTSPSDMQGNYTLIKSGSSIIETGSFQLTLNAPVIAPAPVIPVVPAPIPTAVAPAPTVPVATLIPPTAAISQLLPLAPLAPVFVAEQFGTWQGTWSSVDTKTVVYATGPVTLNLIEDPVLPSAVTGYVQFVGNPILGVIVDVVGEILNNQIILSGSGLGIGSQTIQIDIAATLISPTEMTGTYTQINSSSIIGTGGFAATLLTPVVPIAAPAPAAPVATAPIPTAVAPAPTVPITTLIPPTAAISQLLPLAPLAPVFVAEQFGTWQGTWSSVDTKTVVYATGPVTLNLIEDPVLPTAVAGYVQFVGNPILGVIVDVVGEVLNNQVILSGSGLGIGSQTIQIDIVATLISPTEMTGTYTQINSSSIIGTGGFAATLLTPVVPIAAPAPVVPVVTAPVVTAPVPTVVAPPPTVPVTTVVPPTAAVSQLLPPIPFAPIAPLAFVEQAGTWQGVWTTGLVSGPMTLNLVEDPILGTLAGYCQLLGNPLLGTLVDNLLGNVLNNQVYLEGSGLGAGSTTFQIDIVGTLTSATTMTGTYTLIESSSIRQTGSFEVTLITPVI